jgi:drug/metabolite transporter (DMT)-like permease
VAVALLGMEPMSRRRIFGTLAGLAGVGLAMAPGAALPDLSLLPWALMITLTPICYAASNVLGVRLRPPGASALALAAGATIAGATLLWCATLLSGQFRPGPVNALMLVPLLQGTMGALAFVLYFRSLARHGGVVTSQIGYLITITGLVWGFLFFGEVPGWLTIPAAALVFTGLALVTLPGKRVSPAGA